MNNNEEIISSMDEEEKFMQIQEKAWEELKKACYGENCCVQTEWGIINFSSDGMNDIEGGKKLTYDDYLDVMKESCNKVRHYFELCYYACIYYDFKGQIEKKSKKNICFKRIFINGMYSNGDFVDGKEDHVWMDKKDFEQYEIGDCLSFTAEIYRYLKTGNGKVIDFALRNPKDIQKIDPYQLPSDYELLMQTIDQLVCESCMFYENCYMGMCMADSKWCKIMRQQMFNVVKAKNEERCL